MIKWFFKIGEPSEVIDALFEMLLDLATTYQPYNENCENKPSTSTSLLESNALSTELLLKLKSYSCSALLSLVVARGETGKTLTAVAALLTTQSKNSEEIEIPNNLIALQKSVHSVLLGKTNRPDWLTCGFPKSSLCDSFHLHIPFEKHYHVNKSSISFDGKFLYLLLNDTIYKLGSGYCGTIKGHVVQSCIISQLQSDSTSGWLGFCRDFLYIQTNNWTKNEIVRLDKNNLKEVSRMSLSVSIWGPSACASDLEHLILITSTKDDCFVIRTLKPPPPAPATSSSSYLMPVIQELTIKLAHKCLTVCGGFGNGIFDNIQLPSNSEPKLHYMRSIISGEVEDVVNVCAGKDFSVIQTLNGKVLFIGKAQSLGVKQNGANGMKWSELPITKSPKIVHISTGHESVHALLISEDGSVFFVGLAKRGEDGEHSKARRQPKPVKPKKMIKMEGKVAVTCSCNHGTSAIVTREGELYMFGKDSNHADRNGLITALKNIVVTQVSLGKAHTVVLTSRGHVYTFGISNKGQCGHEFGSSNQAKDLGHSSQFVMRDDENETEVTEQHLDVTEDVTEPLCNFGQHRWRYDQCMICTICGECTGYGPSCIASGKSERNPGMPCGEKLFFLKFLL